MSKKPSNKTNKEGNVIYPSDMLVPLPLLTNSKREFINTSYEYYSTETYYNHVPALLVINGETVYFGEFKETKNNNGDDVECIPNGIGLIGKHKYQKTSSYQMTMCENVTPSKTTIDGFMKRGAAIDITNNSTTFGYYKNNEYGDVSLEVYDDYHCFSCHYYNKNGKLYNIQIKVFPNGNYDINHYIDGQIQNTMFSYENGKFLFKDLSLVDNVIVGSIDNKIKYAYPYKKLYFERDFIEYINTGIKPARFSETSREIFRKYDKEYKEFYDYSGLIKNEYYGGIQTPFVPTWDDRKQEFNSSGYGYGIMPLDGGDMYFGHFSLDCMSGPGVIKCDNGNRYLGFYFENKLNGPCLFLNKNAYKFSAYSTGKKLFEFKIEKDGLTILRYEDGKKTDNYSFIEFESLNYFEYDEKNKLVQKFIFGQKVTETKEVSSELDELLKKGFECIKEKDGKIYIVKCNLYDNTLIDIPNDIYGIKKRAFSECEKLREVVIPKNVCKIEDGAFINCPLMLLQFEECSNNLYLKKDFSNSGKLYDIFFEQRIVRIEKDSFSHCRNLQSVMISNPCCVVEEGAFPDGCKIIKAVINKETFKKEYIDVSKANKTKSKSNKQSSKVTKKKKTNPHHKKEKLDNKDKDKVNVNVFKIILTSILKILSCILIPFKALGGFVKEIYHNQSEKETTISDYLDLILFIIQVLLVSFIVYDGIKHQSEWMLWPANNIPSIVGDVINNYDMFIFNSIFDLAQNSGVLVSILLIIPILLSLILDIIVYILMIVIFVICFIVLIALTLAVSLSPIALVIYYLVTIISSDSKTRKVCYFILSLIITIAYFYIMFTYAGWVLF